MAERSLNVADPQVLVHFPNDANGFVYHHRLLLHKIGNGRWVTLTPDLELEVHDLVSTRHIVLGRHAAFPAHIADSCYVFDDISKNELERQRKLAKTTGSILDDSAAVGVTAQLWYVADPSSDRFGQPIPIDLIDDVVTLGSHGLVQWDSEVEYIKEMGSDELPAFVEARKEASNDLRTIGDHRDSQGRRYLAFADSVALLRESAFEDWGFKGPRSVLEYLKSVLAGPGDITTYHLAWVKASGVAGGSAVVHEHRSICETIRLGLTRDLLDISNSMAFENLVRRLIVLEIAVTRNPGMPDFSGLDVVSESPITMQGAAYVSNMSTWITDRLKEKANIQKQSRLFKEEFGRGAKKTASDDNPEGGKRWRKQGKGRGKGEASGGASGSAGDK